MEIQEKQPAGLWLICATEVFERFSYYAMRALLILYFVYALKIEKSAASNMYGTFISLVYLSGIIGGYVADKFIGQKLAIIAGAVMIAVGQFMLGFENIGMIYSALGLLIMGNGFFKISISTFVGSLYGKNDPRRDAGFTYFYMAVNLGAFFAPLIGGTLGEKFGYRYGFWTAGVVMLLGLIVFLIGKEKFFKGVGDAPVKIDKEEWKKAGLYLITFGSIAYLMWNFGFWAGAFTIALTLLALWIKDKISKTQSAKSELTIEEKKKVAVIFIMAFFVIFFWTAFEQSGAALTLFAKENTNRMVNLFGFQFEFLTTWFQSVNPFFVVVLAPLFSKMWLTLAKKGKEPSTPTKFVWALWLLAAGYGVLLIASMQMGPGVKINMLYLILAYAVFTTGELCLSPVGLSLVTKLAPVHLVGTLMGVWKLANAAANKLAGFYSSYFGVVSNEAFFSGLIIAPVAVSIILIVIMKPVKRWMGDVR
ncbi:Dipeptide/tripeptide permease [Elusimicrobium minutum Pei191]|uniref:Dipeptide/tripeptide permease n=1 Tax=Elusimicrobium minutum (strain Pei191) TaxID=445932 RepID=B2KD79_ELUMP|nr:peptide MFS transporter [Elusimicrobium minutum]ACC98475.1 Dipeptide/tripeptide permease [Elusimicrobium minutum Pei191]